MRTKIFISLIFLFFFLIGTLQNVLATDISECGYINTSGTWILQNDITNNTFSSAYCFKITADDVIFFLDDRVIKISDDDTYAQIEMIDRDNVTIRDGHINFFDYVTYGIRMTGSNSNITIEDMNITDIDKFQDTTGIYSYNPNLNLTIKDVEVLDAKYGIVLSYVQDVDIRDSVFKNSRTWDIWIAPISSNVFGCGLDYDTILDDGTNTSITKSPCADIDEITLDISVFDGEKIHLPPDDYCNSFSNATVCVNGDCLYNYTHIEEDVYCVSGYPAKSLYVFQFNITSGIRTVTANWEDYVPFSEEKYYSSEYNVSKNIILYPYVSADIELLILNAHNSQRIPSASHSLFYSNGTCVWDIWTNKCMQYYTWSDGTGRFTNLGLNLNYYYTVQKTGYKKYSSDIFNLTTNRDDTVYLIPTDETIDFDINPKVGEASTLFNFTVNTSIMPPFYVYVDCIDGGELSVQWTSNDYNSSKIVQGSEFLYSGTYVCTATIKEYTSNSVSIKLEGIEETASELGYFAFLLSPIFISAIILLGFSGFIEHQLKADGKAFLLSFLVISLILTILGIFPWWLGFVLIVVSGVLVVKFIFGVF